MTAAERLQRIKLSIRHGDYTVLRGGGEALVFAQARTLGITGSELMHRWAGDAGAAAADKATCSKCVGSGMLDDDTVCDRCSGTGDSNYRPEKYPPDHDFSNPETDGPDDPNDDDADEDDDVDHRREGDDDDDEDDDE